MAWTSHIELADVKEELLDYIKANPNSQDTLEGVIEWWIVHSRLRRGIKFVKTALQELEEEGLVVRITIRNNVEIYKVRS